MDVENFKFTPRVQRLNELEVKAIFGFFKQLLPITCEKELFLLSQVEGLDSFRSFQLLYFGLRKSTCTLLSPEFIFFGL